MLPLTYILIVKGTVMAVGILLIILGVFLLLKGKKGDFDFSISFLDKISTKLKGADAGLLMILLGFVLMISVLLIPMKAETVIPVEKKLIPPLKNAPFSSPEEAFKDTNKE